MKCDDRKKDKQNPNSHLGSLQYLCMQKIAKPLITSENETILTIVSTHSLDIDSQICYVSHICKKHEIFIIIIAVGICCASFTELG